MCIADCVTHQVFGDEADMYKIEDVQIQDLGKVGEVTVTKDDCLLMKVRTSTIYFMSIVALCCQPPLGVCLGIWLVNTMLRCRRGTVRRSVGSCQLLHGGGLQNCIKISAFSLMTLKLS